MTPQEHTDYRIGDLVRLTATTYGERITNRKGEALHMSPHVVVYEGVVKFVGPEAEFEGAVSVVRCDGGDKALKLNTGFSFYPKDNGVKQMVEVLTQRGRRSMGALDLETLRSLLQKSEQENEGVRDLQDRLIAAYVEAHPCYRGGDVGGYKSLIAEAKAVAINVIRSLLQKG